jgi:fructokinase
VTRHGTLRLPAPPTVVVDTVAAGDTFTAGLLAALERADALGGRLTELSDETLADAMRYGLRAAAITCSRAGANPPYLSEMA